MDKYFRLFLIFSFLSLSAVGLSVYRSPLFSTGQSRAEGFGISPPYFKNNQLKPGDIYSQEIDILRSQAKTAAKAEVKIDSPEIADWFEIEPGSTINLGEGKIRTPVGIKVIVPDNAKAGVYRGFIFFTMLTEENFVGVGIRVGAMAEINIRVIANGEINPPTGNFDIINNDLYDKYRGQIISAASTSKIYYIAPETKRAILLESSDQMANFIKEQGKGITNKDLEKIPVYLNNLSGADADNDSLPDNLEVALGTNKDSSDSDNDLFSDADEINNGYSPTKKYAALPIDLQFALRQAGRIFLQVESRGEAWYVSPHDNKRYFLIAPAVALSILDSLAIKISDQEFKLLIGQ